MLNSYFLMAVSFLSQIYILTKLQLTSLFIPSPTLNEIIFFSSLLIVFAILSCTLSTVLLSFLKCAVEHCTSLQSLQGPCCIRDKFISIVLDSFPLYTCKNCISPFATDHTQSSGSAFHLLTHQFFPGTCFWDPVCNFWV